MDDDGMDDDEMDDDERVRMVIHSLFEEFTGRKKIILDKAKKQVNTIMGDVRKSADKAIIGKAIWKQVSVPSILYGRAVVPTSKTLAGNLQRKENMVWRHILGIGGYSAVASLRGEVGSSLMKTRID